MQEQIEKMMIFRMVHMSQLVRLGMSSQQQVETTKAPLQNLTKDLQCLHYYYLLQQEPERTLTKNDQNSNLINGAYRNMINWKQ